MKQRVKFVSYLAKNTINLADVKTSAEAILLPAGAEVIDVSVEVKTPATAAITADFGLAGAQDFFINDIALNTKGTHNSSVKAEIATAQTLNITLSSAATDGEIIVRALFFMPSEIVLEA